MRIEETGSAGDRHSAAPRRVCGTDPPDFAWSQLELRNRHGLSTVLERQGGRSWDLEEIVFRGRRTAYQTFTVHREPMLHVRARRTGEKKEMALFGSLLEHDGCYKLFSFNIDRQGHVSRYGWTSSRTFRKRS